jgi:Cys-tRNA(Pro)/Cys-tRNA(Cys) deacylase
MKKLAAACSAKRAGMKKRADAERIAGYKRGGTRPFGQMRRQPTLIEKPHSRGH